MFIVVAGVLKKKRSVATGCPRQQQAEFLESDYQFKPRLSSNHVTTYIGRKIFDWM
jgi:hypothetical protein